MEEDKDVDFIDAEARSGGKEKITFREIVLSHLKRIGTFASVEFRGGFWEHKPNPDVQRNDTIDVYIYDTREIYSNAVEYLYDILYPHFDKKMKDEGKEILNELERVYKDHTVLVEEDREGVNYKEGIKEDKMIEEFERRTFKDADYKLSYRKLRLIICRKLFRALCCFLKRIDYFKGQSIDEVT